jgi:hypothetical protein
MLENFFQSILAFLRTRSLLSAWTTQDHAIFSEKESLSTLHVPQMKLHGYGNTQSKARLLYRQPVGNIETEAGRVPELSKTSLPRALSTQGYS